MEFSCVSFGRSHQLPGRERLKANSIAKESLTKRAANREAARPRSSARGYYVLFNYGEMLSCLAGLHCDRSHGGP